MALSVQTNNAAITALKHLNTNSMNMNKSLERLSSGFRVNSAADDASGFAVSSKLSAQGERLKAASLNASQAQAMVKMADAGINEIQNMVGRIQSLATQAASANNAGELGKLDAERIKLESAIDKIASGTNYNGVQLLDGTTGSATTFQVGANNVTGDQVAVNLGNAYTTTALSLAGGVTAGGIDSQANAQTYINTAKTALDTLITNRADLGATQNQLSYIQANLATGIEQVSASVSSIKDADMAAEMATFTKNQILTQAGTSMLAQANQAAQNVLSLFR